MAPAFAHCPPPRRARLTQLSTPALRLAARARRAASSAPEAAPHARKRRKTEPLPAPTPTPAVQTPVRIALPQVADRVLEVERGMSERLGGLRFGKPVTHVYDPLRYAWEAHEWYVKEYGNSRKDILLVGMNPGPWGMAQTGVPFGEVNVVRDWLKMPPHIAVSKPEREHPKRPVFGMHCQRSEVSGRRLWAEWAKEQYGDDPHAFFERFYVHNYCPLMFMEQSGRNRTPVQLCAYERQQVVEICDEALREVVRSLRPQMVCGIGGFATERCRSALKGVAGGRIMIGTVLHPSPASPLANRGWAAQAKAKMEEHEKAVAEADDPWAEPAEGRKADRDEEEESVS